MRIKGKKESQQWYNIKSEMIYKGKGIKRMNSREERRLKVG
jgi:hypothetical protein